MRTLITLFALSVTFGAACSWAVPADPGLNARERAAPIQFDPGPAGPGVAAPAPMHVDPRAAGIYAQRCGTCHELFHPTDYSAAEWPTYVNKYAPRAGLYGTERAMVLRWLQANAGG